MINTYQLHDTHGHLDLLLEKLGYLPSSPDRGDYNDILDSITIAQVESIVRELLKNHSVFVQPTVSTVNFERNFELWKTIDTINVLIGSHPEIVTPDFDVDAYIQNQTAVITKLSADTLWHQKVIGVGECGLDYYYSQDTTIKRKQWKLFESQIQLAIRMDKPLVIHCRDAFDDLFGILDQFPQIQGKFDIHCFTGNRDTARRVLEYGGCMGIGGIVTFKNSADLRDAVDFIPMDKILIETDLPFLAPVPYRGKDCLPPYIDEVAAVIGSIKNLTHDELWRQLEENTRRLYSL